MTASQLTLSMERDTYLHMVHRRRLYSGILGVVFFLLLGGGFRLADARNAGSFFDGIHRIFDFPAEVLGEAWQKVDQLPGHMVFYFPSLVETFNIAAVSTLSGTLLAIVFSLLSTRGLALWPKLIPIFRTSMDVMRALPEIVIALILIFVLGGGPVPAMIAIALHTVGALGKMFSEVNENTDLKPIEGLSSVGATWLQRMVFAVIPQVLPNYVSYTLLRLEINIRASAILGFVGAGGIGYELKNTMVWGQGKYDEAAAIFLLLITTIFIVDQGSSYLRNRQARVK